MRNKNNTEANRHKTETAEDIELALTLLAIIVTAFAAGYFVASAQIASLLGFWTVLFLHGCELQNLVAKKGNYVP